MTARRQTIRHRIMAGWSIDDACEKPVATRNNHHAKNMSVAKLARLNNMPYRTLYYRLVTLKMPQIDAICQPKMARKRTKEEILKAKAIGLNKSLTCEYILKCRLLNLEKWLAEYSIDWPSQSKHVPVKINDTDFPNLKAACKANNANIRAYYRWRENRKGSHQELLQQYIDYRASKK